MRSAATQALFPSVFMRGEYRVYDAPLGMHDFSAKTIYGVVQFDLFIRREDRVRQAVTLHLQPLAVCFEFLQAIYQRGDCFGFHRVWFLACALEVPPLRSAPRHSRCSCPVFVRCRIAEGRSEQPRKDRFSS